MAAESNVPKFDNSRAERREQRRMTRSNRNPVVSGIILMVIGGLFLIQSMTGIPIGRGWAFLTLIPGALVLLTAWQQYQANEKRFNQQVLRSGLTGIFFIYLSMALFFNLQWLGFWPLVLIAIGFLMLFRDTQN